MGRRSINTTKSGKYMNPTDQARKEARKKELKKNKRQRQMVRAAVLKNKDPGQILEEMEKIDEMEYNVLQPSPLNEKVLRDKRKKLKETFDRVMRLYQTEEPEHWSELKRKEVEYEKRRLKKQQYYESVKHAQSVQIDEIPLPSTTQTPPISNNLSGITFGGPTRMPPPPTALSLPPFAPGAPPGTLKKPKEDVEIKFPDKNSESKQKENLGVPPGPPPNLLEMKELDSDAENDEVILKEYNSKSVSKSTKRTSKPTTVQQRILAISGQNIDDFMKEMENVHKKKEKEREAALRGQTLAGSLDEGDDGSKKYAKFDDENSNENTDSSHDSNDSEENSDNDEDSSSSPNLMKRGISIKDNRADEKIKSSSLTTEPIAVPVAIPLPPAPTSTLSHMQIPAPPMPPVTNLVPPASIMFRPPPLRPPIGIPNFGIRMPHGPPPGPPRAPHSQLSGSGMLPSRMGVRMPPGPPPGMPPRMSTHHHKNQQAHNKDLTKGITTITAKPQIRNLSADVTRFVPSALRVKREDSRKPNRTKPYAQETSISSIESGNKAATKDDAYLQFMNEMQGLL